MRKQSGGKPPGRLPYPVVGLGASAGGIEALKLFLEALPSNTGAAFVVVLPLSPEHSSSLSAVLQPRTAMPITQVTETVRIEPNHVYVIAPACALTMSEDELNVEKKAATDTYTASIDLFFRSLAAAHRDRAVGIVLSGAGSDGSVGITRIKELGGITVAQAPAEAEHSSMPRAAIATGMIDFTLPASDMPRRLLDF